MSFFEAGRVSACRGYELALEKKKQVVPEMDGGAEPERAVACPEGPEGERREKRQSRHEGRMRRQVGKREHANSPATCDAETELVMLAIPGPPCMQIR